MDTSPHSQLFSYDGPDAHANVALKYRFLFDLEEDARILLVGVHSRSDLSDFQRIFDRVRATENYHDLRKLQLSAKYDFILAGYDRNGEAIEFEEQIPEIAGWLKPTGTLLLAVPNRSSIQIAAAALRRRKLHMPAGLSPWGYKKLLARCAFKNVSEFLIMPDYQEPEDFIHTKYGNVELRSDARIIYKGLCKLGLYRFFHSHYLYIATRKEPTRIESLLSHLREYMVTNGIECGPLVVEQFSLRTRGALILLISDEIQRLSFVVRVATYATVDATIAKHVAWTDRIHSHGTLDQAVKAAVPRSVGTFLYRGCNVYVETRIPGVLAWKAAKNHRAESRLRADSCRSIYSFNLATRKKRVVDDELFQNVVGSGLDEVKRLFSGSSNCVDAIENITSLLRESFEDKTVFIVWGHGDFGYGNILCDPKTSQINGVIDWDTGVSHELPAVDLFNLLLQSESQGLGGDVAKALGKIYQDLLKSEPVFGDASSYDTEEFNLTQADLIVHLCIATLRFVMRSASYPKEFDEKKRLNSEILATVGEILGRTVHRR